MNKKNNNNSKSNSLNLKALDKKVKVKIICRTLHSMITEELMRNMKDKMNREIVHRLSGMIDKEVNLEAKRVLNLHLEFQIYFDV